MKIAIDGPSGSGKSTISKAIARELKIGYLDTGAMYRAVTAWLIKDQTELPNDWEMNLNRLPELIISTDPENFFVQIDSNDVTEEIRTQRITDSVSKVSANATVRSWMVQMQKNIVKDLGAIVMEGRDIASVVMPEADVKLFLTADLDQRASRRSAELGQDSTVTQDSIKERDFKDANRAISPLNKSQAAIEIDTTFMDIAQSVNAALEIVRKSLND
jgi:cytidylate kinase